MVTVPRPPAPRKAFYAHLHGDSGILAQVDDAILFMAYESGDITTIASYAGLTVLGEVGLADTQQIMDRLHGGSAAIACARLQEVA
jgi:hypothetical protein